MTDDIRLKKIKKELSSDIQLAKLSEWYGTDIIFLLSIIDKQKERIKELESEVESLHYTMMEDGDDL